MSDRNSTRCPATGPDEIRSFNPKEPEVTSTVWTAHGLTKCFPGMDLDTAMTLLDEADQAAAGDPAETLGQFLAEERDPMTGALNSGARYKVTKRPDGRYDVTVLAEDEITG